MMSSHKDCLVKQRRRRMFSKEVKRLSGIEERDVRIGFWWQVLMMFVALTFFVLVLWDG